MNYPRQYTSPRTAPYFPRMGQRVQIRRHAALSAFEKQAAEGKAFLPIWQLPPWKRDPLTNYAERIVGTRNYSGIRVAAVDLTDEPGFATNHR